MGTPLAGGRGREDAPFPKSWHDRLCISSKCDKRRLFGQVIVVMFGSMIFKLPLRNLKVVIGVGKIGALLLVNGSIQYTIKIVWP